MRERFPGVSGDREQRLRIDGDGVAVAQEDLCAVAVVDAGHGDILFDFFKGADAVALVFIHSAKGALIMGTAYCALEQIARGLAERAEDVAFISHVFILK